MGGLGEESSDLPLAGVNVSGGTKAAKEASSRQERIVGVDAAVTVSVIAVLQHIVEGVLADERD